MRLTLLRDGLMKTVRNKMMNERKSKTPSLSAPGVSNDALFRAQERFPSLSEIVSRAKQSRGTSSMAPPDETSVTVMSDIQEEDSNSTLHQRRESPAVHQRNDMKDETTRHKAYIKSLVGTPFEGEY